MIAFFFFYQIYKTNIELILVVILCIFSLNLSHLLGKFIRAKASKVPKPLKK